MATDALAACPDSTVHQRRKVYAPPLPFFPSQSKSIFARVTKAMCLTPSPNKQPLMRNGLPQRDCALRKASLLLSSCQVVPDSLQPCGVQHARLPCPSLSPGVCSNSCPLNWWCHPTISYSVTHFSSCPQSSPASTIILFKSRRFAISGAWEFPLPVFMI